MSFEQPQEESQLQEKDGEEERLDKHKEILNQLQSIFDIKDLELQEKEALLFINKRIEELESEGHEGRVITGLRGKQVENSFISSNDGIFPSHLGAEIKINDPDIYNALLHSLQQVNLVNKAGDNMDASDAIVFALGNYFGNYYGSEDTTKMHNAFASSSKGVMDLKDFKGQGLAVCAEKAPVAHNYYKFLGMDSNLILSNLTCQSQKMPHAYVLLRTEKGKFISDPTNPIIFRDKEMKIVGIRSGQYKISEEEYSQLMSKDNYPVEVIRYNYLIDEERPAGERRVKDEKGEKMIFE